MVKACLTAVASNTGHGVESKSIDSLDCYGGKSGGKIGCVHTYLFWFSDLYRQVVYHLTGFCLFPVGFRFRPWHTAAQLPIICSQNCA